MLIYTFLLILVFMYIGAKAEMEKIKAEGGAETEETAELPDDPDAEEQTGFFAWFKGRGKDKGKGEEEKIAAGEKTDAVDSSNGSQADEGSGIGGTVNDGEESGSQNKDGMGPLIREEDMWALILTNAKYPIPEDYSVELKALPGTEQSVDARIYDTTVRMMSDMKAEGLRPIVCSAYRTLDKQEILFNRKVKSYVKRGYSMEDAYKEAQHVLSIPGSGEHCLGLAIDVCSQSYQKLEEGFEDTKEGKWLRENCAEYGFILRYEKGKEESTGINYEPWHFRYVGVDVARYMMEKGITLEEFYIEESLYG